MPGGLHGLHDRKSQCVMHVMDHRSIAIFFFFGSSICYITATCIIIILFTRARTADFKPNHGNFPELLDIQAPHVHRTSRFRRRSQPRGANNIWRR
jgi:hypothetical protein